MTVKELKELLKNIPDDYDVVVDCPDDEAGDSIVLYPDSLDIDDTAKEIMFTEL